MSMLKLLHSTFKYTIKSTNLAFLDIACTMTICHQPQWIPKDFDLLHTTRSLYNFQLFKQWAQKVATKQTSMFNDNLWTLSLKFNVQLLSLTRGGDGNVVVVKIVAKMNKEVQHTSYKTSCIVALWWRWPS
jgi:hypothetical protein